MCCGRSPSPSTSSNAGACAQHHGPKRSSAYKKVMLHHRRSHARPVSRMYHFPPPMRYASSSRACDATSETDCAPSDVSLGKVSASRFMEAMRLMALASKGDLTPAQLASKMIESERENGNDPDAETVQLAYEVAQTLLCQHDPHSHGHSHTPYPHEWQMGKYCSCCGRPREHCVNAPSNRPQWMKQFHAIGPAGQCDGEYIPWSSGAASYVVRHPYPLPQPICSHCHFPPTNCICGIGETVPIPHPRHHSRSTFDPSSARGLQLPPRTVLSNRDCDVRPADIVTCVRDRITGATRCSQEEPTDTVMCADDVNEY